MIDNNLLFFCTMCRDKSQEDITKIECKIEHTIKHFKKGEYLYLQGEKITHLNMLIKGRVKTEIASSSGFILPVEEIEAPYPLAAAFLFADNNYSQSDVIAIEECQVLIISKESIEKQIAKCPGFLRGFLAFNANRTQYISERLKIFAQKGIKAKIVYYILSKAVNNTFELDKSIASLAEYFGVERPSLSRALSEMVKDRIITFKLGKGTIINYKALNNLLC